MFNFGVVAMLDCIKSQNQCINTIVFPGGMAHPSYTIDRYHNSVKFSLIFIPFQGSCTSTLSSCCASPTMIPALLYINTSGKANKFCINFHGNACDVGQIAMCAEKEGRAFNSHYLLVEYPRFGVADGHPNEVTLNAVSLSVHAFVMKEFHVLPSEIILLGRSIGTGPVCELASQLTKQNTPPAAVILQSPYCSIRDVTYDLLGCVNYFLLDRWENWSKLVGSIDDPSVVKCPVLFIHADGDKVINYNHSLLMHEYRTKCGLKSELFVQKSDAHFVKGHNYFDYDRDVVVPSAEFIVRNVNNKTATGTPTTPNTATNTTTNSIHNTTPIRVITINKETVRLHSTIPPHFANKYTSEQELEYKGNSSVFKSMKCTYDVYLGWCCCPCVFCTECTVACNYNTAQYLLQNTCCVPMFNYQSLRPAGDPSRNTLYTAIFKPSEFGKSVREEEAATSAGNRQRMNRSYSRKDGGSVTNPLLAGSSIGDIESSKGSGTSGSASGTSSMSGSHSHVNSSTNALIQAAGLELGTSSAKLDYVPG